MLPQRGNQGKFFTAENGKFRTFQALLIANPQKFLPAAPIARGNSSTEIHSFPPCTPERTLQGGELHFAQIPKKFRPSAGYYSFFPRLYLTRGESLGGGKLWISVDIENYRKMLKYFFLGREIFQRNFPIIV